MTTRSLIVLNWKMNVPKERIGSLARCLARNSSRVSGRAQIIVCPSHELVSSTSDALKKSNAGVSIGAQNCAKNLWGAHTGEISPESLKRLGCSYVIIGHSERRMSGLESKESIRQKVELLLGSHTLPTPILCIGEHTRMRSEARVSAYLAIQLESALHTVAEKKLSVSRLVVAYEPVWAIGTGTPVSFDIWKHRHAQIAYLIEKVTGSSSGSRFVPILYGGSVNEKNMMDFLVAPSGGVLVGGSGQRVDSLSRLLKVL